MAKDIIDRLYDENDTSNIVLYDDKHNPVEFEQIAIVPIESDVYVLLHPVNYQEFNMQEDEALVFYINEDERSLTLIDDDEIVKAVFKAYEEDFSLE